MDAAADRKLFLGGRLKRLRRDLALTQTAIDPAGNISPATLVPVTIDTTDRKSVV